MSRYRSEIIVSVFLVLITLAPYWQVRNHGFINYDDDDYVTENRLVQEGLTWEGISWAFMSKFHGHWHPVTWLSHMVDCQLFGMNPTGHHLVSAFLHIANTLLLFLILNRMTGALLRSAFVAALFALHPLHVESVAWVADRKDVLSTSFWLLAMWAYAHYAEHPGLGRYLLILVAFILGLMAKPIVVTLPVALLLMDYWPLGRFQFGGLSNGERRPDGHEFLNSRYQKSPVRCLIWEKVLFFIVMGGFAMVAVLARQEGTAIIEALLKLLPEKSHIAHVLHNYGSYIGKTFWPLKLATPYPRSDILPVWRAGGAALLLVCISFLAFWKGRRYPYLPVGWLWYLITLLPVIGVVKLGPHLMADRYTYLPLIGVFIMIAWAVPDFLAKWQYRRLVLGILAGMLLSCLTVCTWLQVRYWKSSTTLFEHVVTIVPNNPVALNNLGAALEADGRLDKAISYYSEALRIGPNLAHVHNNLGAALVKQKRFAEAMAHYSEAVRIKPDYAEAHFNLAVELDRQGKANEAIRYYSEALRLQPDYVEAHNGIGVVLEREGRLDEATSHYSEAVRIRPDYMGAQFNLGAALAKQGRVEEAIGHFSEVIRLKPDYKEAHNKLGIALGKQGQFNEALEHFVQALKIEPDYAEAHNNLGMVLYRQGRIEEAISHYTEALRLKSDSAEVHDNLGRALAKQGRIEEATIHFSEAIRIRRAISEGLQP